MKQLTSICLALILTASISLASAKTLPQGVWKIDAYQNNYQITELAANPSGDRETWKSVKLKDGVMSDIYLLTVINGSIHGATDGASNPNTQYILDLTTKLAHHWKKQKTHLDIAYGISDKLTVFANISHEKAEVDYTDEYVVESNKIDSFFVANGISDKAAAYNVAPDKASSNHLNDIFLGLKYSHNASTSLAYKFTAAGLKTGVDSLEKTVEDGKQELETSNGYDEHHLYLFKDLSVLNHPLQLTLGHIFIGKHWQNFLDNKLIQTDLGNLTILKVTTPINIGTKMQVNLGVTSIMHGSDKYKGGNSAFSNSDPAGTLSSGHTNWTTVPKSSGTTVMGNLEISYQPKIFLKGFVKSVFVLSNKPSGQIFAFPGRLQPGTMVSAGLTLFYK